VGHKPQQELIPTISKDNSMPPCTAKLTKKEPQGQTQAQEEEAVEEAVVEEEEEEALREHLSQLVNHKHRLLS
jgi:ribosomal protein L12E/L44/L45/RPP1/RPP2